MACTIGAFGSLTILCRRIAAVIMQSHKGTHSARYTDNAQAVCFEMSVNGRFSRQQYHVLPFVVHIHLAIKCNCDLMNISECRNVNVHGSAMIQEYFGISISFSVINERFSLSLRSIAPTVCNQPTGRVYFANWTIVCSCQSGKWPASRNVNLRYSRAAADRFNGEWCVV